MKIKAPTKIHVTAREKETWRLIALGASAAEAAKRMNIGVRTVESYRRNLGIKLSAKNTADITRLAIVHRVIRADEKLK